MIGFELVELNPTLDINHQTAELAVSLIESAVGKTII
jgi:arginase family enzyme